MLNSNYQILSKIGEGTFSIVYKAISRKTGQQVALKCMKSHFKSIEHVNSHREIRSLRQLSPHSHIITLIEILYDESTGRLVLVFELMNGNLFELTKGRKQSISESLAKKYIFQLLTALNHMHRKGIFHRDIKPENILVSDSFLKLADLGSCKNIASNGQNTEYISTRWYRPPECLMTDGHYSYKMDIWGVGCVFFEILALFPLFPGQNELDQVHKIHHILGTPNPELLEHFQARASHMEFDFEPKNGIGISRQLSHVSRSARDLILKMIAYDERQRITAKQALEHPYFDDIRQPKSQFNSFNELPTIRKNYNRNYAGKHKNTLSELKNYKNVGKKYASPYRRITK